MPATVTRKSRETVFCQPWTYQAAPTPKASKRRLIATTGAVMRKMKRAFIGNSPHMIARVMV